LQIESWPVGAEKLYLEMEFSKRVGLEDAVPAFRPALRDGVVCGAASPGFPSAGADFTRGYGRRSRRERMWGGRGLSCRPTLTAKNAVRMGHPRVQVGTPAIATEGEEMQLAGLLIAMQSRGHWNQLTPARKDDASAVVVPGSENPDHDGIRKKASAKIKMRVELEDHELEDRRSLR
jgi:hypothetical protein